MCWLLRSGGVCRLFQRDRMRVGGEMNQMIERFITPRMVEKYYDKTILLSPLFLLLTAVYAVTSWRVFHSLHGKDLLLVMILIASVWVHFIVQHSWFRG